MAAYVESGLEDVAPHRYFELWFDGRVSGCRCWSVHQDVFVDFVVQIVASIVGTEEHFQMLSDAVERKLTEAAAVDPRRVEFKRTQLSDLNRDFESAKSNFMAAPECLRDELVSNFTGIQNEKKRLEQSIKELEKAIDPVALRNKWTTCSIASRSS